MIIRGGADRLVLITQPDHAALAGRIMASWRDGGLPDHPRRASIFRAIARHDDGWQPVDRSPLVDDDGRCLDFIDAPIDVRRGVWPRSVASLEADPFAAALVAEHARLIFDRFRDDPGWREFFDTVTGLRDEHAARAGVPASVVEADYVFLRAADLMSLTFCNGWTDPQVFAGYTMQLSDETLAITPDPFGGAVVTMDVLGRALPARAFASADDARRTFDAAPVVMLHGVARGA